MKLNWHEDNECYLLFGKEQTNKGLSLEEILYRIDLRLPGEENGKN